MYNPTQEMCSEERRVSGRFKPWSRHKFDNRPWRTPPWGYALLLAAAGASAQSAGEVEFSRSDVVGDFGTFTSTGAGHTFGASYTLYLPPAGGRRSYVSLGLEDKVFDAAVINDTVVGVDRRSRPVTLGYTARTDSDTAAWPE